MNQIPSLSRKITPDRTQRLPDQALQRQKLPPLEFAGATKLEKKESTPETQKNAKPKNQSFSDMLSPDQVHTVIDLSLEKELEKHKQAANGQTANKLEKSNFFDESSIKKNSVDMHPPAYSPEKADAESFFSEEVNRVLLRVKQTSCILCGKAAKDFPEGLTTINKTQSKLANQNENDDVFLIHPCLCNFKSHRECLKAYVIVSRKVGCDRCKVLYAISPQKLSLSPKKDLKRFATFLTEILVMLLITGLFMFALDRVVARHKDGTITSEALFVILVIFCLFIIILTVVGGISGSGENITRLKYRI